MLSKKFRSNKFYQVTRYTFKYGNEWDEMENTVTVWDTYEKAMAYIERYSSGLKFASAQIEVNNLDREITYEDYKKGNYNIVSFQKIYDVTLDGTEDTEPEEIIYMADKKEEQKAEKVAPQKGAYKVTCGGRMGYYFETLTEARAYAEKYASEDNLPYKIFLEIGRDIKEIETIKPPIKYYIVKGYLAQFSNLRAATNFAKGIKANQELVIYAVKRKSDTSMVILEPVSTIGAYQPKLVKANIVEKDNKICVHIEDEEKIFTTFFNTRHEAEHYLKAFLKIRDKPNAA